MVRSQQTLAVNF